MMTEVELIERTVAQLASYKFLLDAGAYSRLKQESVEELLAAWQARLATLKKQQVPDFGKQGEQA
ncbi:MAG: hypothetical protein V3V96_14310 [Acidiferrobacterales bacterium]